MRCEHACPAGLRQAVRDIKFDSAIDASLSGSALFVEVGAVGRCRLCGGSKRPGIPYSVRLRETDMTSEKPSFATGDLVVYPTHGVGKIVGIETQEIAGSHAERLCCRVRQGQDDVACAAGENQGVRAAQIVEPQGDGRGARQAARPFAGQAHDVEPPCPGVSGQDRVGRPGLDSRGRARSLPQLRPARAIL